MVLSGHSPELPEWAGAPQSPLKLKKPRGLDIPRERHALLKLHLPRRAQQPRAEELQASRASGKGQLQEAAASPVLSGTPTLPSAAGTAETGTRSLTFPSPAAFPESVTLKLLLTHLCAVKSLMWRWGGGGRTGDRSH